MSLKEVHHAATERGKYISNNSCRVRGKLLVCEEGGKEEEETERERGIRSVTAVNSQEHNDFYTLYSGRLVTPGHVLSLGVPTNLNILLSCSSTSLPGNSGRPPLAISA